jgi:hypothetical protein
VTEGSEAVILMEEDVNTSEEGPTEKQMEFDEWYFFLLLNF